MPSYAPKPPTCLGCPAYNVGRSYVPGRGPKDTVIAFVGQGPGRVEAHQGRPFVGDTGARLTQWIEEAGFHEIQLDTHSVFKDNVVRCWLPGNRIPTKAERDFCTKVHLDPTLRELPNLKFIVAIGVPAMRHFFGEHAGERTAGTIRPWRPSHSQGADGPRSGNEREPFEKIDRDRAEALGSGTLAQADRRPDRRADAGAGPEDS